MDFEAEAFQSLASTPQHCAIPTRDHCDAGIGRIELAQVALPARRTIAEYTDRQRRVIEGTYDLAAGFGILTFALVRMVERLRVVESSVVAEL